jgi:glycosyltransferase involved in cell wall biosynthesis
LPDGIDLEAFQPIDRAEARRRLGEASDDGPWVLFSSVSGTSSPVKRPALARAAFDRFKRAEPRAKFKFLTGQPHELVPVWVNASDVVLLTSTREGWPNIVKEALACNVPFVSTDVSDLSEIAEAEPSCFVADAEPGALADALQAAVGAGRKADLRKHTLDMEVETIGLRLKAIYERVLSDESANHRVDEYPRMTKQHEERR